jgi:hypothetical protein
VRFGQRSESLVQTSGDRLRLRVGRHQDRDQVGCGVGCVRHLTSHEAIAERPDRKDARPIARFSAAGARPG